MKGLTALTLITGLLAGCAALSERPDPAPEAPEPPPVQTTGAEDMAPAPRPDEAPATAVPAATGPSVLGRTVASLGDPTQGGAWLATGLVSAPAPGRVTDLGTGAQAVVELRPSAAGSGGRLSVAGFQALGLPLTALPDLEVARE